MNLIEPLRIENAKMLKENNELLYEIIRVKEDKDNHSNKSLFKVNNLDNEVSDLKFLLDKKLGVIRGL